MASGEPAVDLWTLSDLTTPWCIRVVTTLRIAEHIDAGITDIDALATATGSDAGALHSVLSYLVTRGLFIEEPLGRFALNDPSRGLLGPGAFLSLDGIGGRMAHSWSTLPTFVKTGKPGYADMFGAPFWEDLDAHQDVAADFDALMSYAGHGTPSAALQLTGGWDGVRTVVDVGGGTGAMLAELLRAHLHLRGVLVDLPGPVARSREVFEAAGVAERISVTPQSIFDPLPGGADVYLLRPSGTVVVLGGVVPDGIPRPLRIEMVLLGGRDNTVTEFRELARQAGLELIAAEERAPYFVVECRAVATG